jgi:phosphoketolase
MNAQTALCDVRRMDEANLRSVATGTPARELTEHEQDINRNAEDLPEIRNWKWGQAKAGTPAEKRPAHRA